MPVTSQFLKNIMAEARPIIERQMDDAKLIAGFRDIVSANGGDWSALKALIKAHVEDENDETGEGKRVQKIRDKADSTSAYADMLGLANMNENNFSASHSYAEATGRERPAQKIEEGLQEALAVAKGEAEPARWHNREPVQEMHKLPEGAATQEQPETASHSHAKASEDNGSTDKDRYEVVTAATGDASRPSVGGGTDAFIPHPPVQPLSERADKTEAALGSPAVSAPISALVAQRIEQEVPNLSVAGSNPAERSTIPDEGIPAFLKRERKPLRPNCLNPDNCAGYGTHTCHRCTVAAREVEPA